MSLTLAQRRLHANVAYTHVARIRLTWEMRLRVHASERWAQLQNIIQAQSDYV